jgi:hypothetical protein
MARRPTAASALDSPPSELVAELEVGAGWSLNNNNWLENGMHPVIFLVWNHHFFNVLFFCMEHQFLWFGRYHGHEYRFHVQFKGCRYER